MARAATKKVKPPKQIVHAPGVPGVVQAAQIALVAMRIAKVSRWEEFCEKPVDELRQLVSLTQEQQGLLEEHRRILRNLQVKPVVTVAACDVCGRYGYAGSAAMPTKCPWTMRCSGTVRKASATAYRPRAT